MSLEVYLTAKDKVFKKQGSGIFVREHGQTVEISRDEWDARYPDRQPVVFRSDETETNEIYSANITHNLGKMADEAGVYYALWRPEEKGWEQAEDIIPVLEEGLEKLQQAPDYYKQFNPENGWGSYETLVSFVEKYLAACKEHPEAEVGVSR